MGLLNDIFGGGSDDMDSAIGKGNDALNQYYQDAKGFMSPFLQNGLSEFGQYQHGVNAMQDPNGFINNLMSQYHASPQYQMQVKQGDNGLSAGAAASGMLGSGNFMTNLASYNQNLANNDQNNYLQQRLGVYNNFLQNAGHMYGMGQDAANSLGSWGMQHGNDLANMYGREGAADMEGDQTLAGNVGGLLGGIAHKLF